MAKRRTFFVGNGARGVRRALVLVALAAGMQTVAAAGGGDSRVPQPTIGITTAGKCVEDTQFMLRNHMDLLKHHRDRTVHEGVRTTQHSLANCVACHASPQTGRVTGSKDAFCEGCHGYAAVRLDCFECHADRPAARIAASTSSLMGGGSAVPGARVGAIP